MAARQKVLLVSETTGYQLRQFRDAAAALGIGLTLASNRCHQLEDPWRDQAIPVRFEDPKAALAAVKAQGPYQGITASGDRAAVLAAQLAAQLKLPFHSERAAQLGHDKFAFKQTLQAAGLPVPWFRREKIESDPRGLSAQVQYPCVLKPLMLSASRGVIRTNTPDEFAAAFIRIRRLLESPPIRAQQDANSLWIQLEGYIPGVECALEGWMAAGTLQRFALFDKPDPLQGPYFEESVYITPSRLPTECRALIWDMVEAAARAARLGPGPIHAEIRLQRDLPGGDVAFVLEVAARSIGGLCGRALRFRAKTGSDQASIGLEELLLRGALGQPLTGWELTAGASGVMMIPIPHSGILDEVTGTELAARLPGIEGIEITAKPDQPLEALPEGASYLGFIFARSATPTAAEQALRGAYGKLGIRMRDALPVS